MDVKEGMFFRYRGIFCAIAAPMVYILMSAVVKHSPSANMPTFLFFRFFFGCFFFVPFFLKSFKKPPAKILVLNFIRACSGILSVLCSVYSYRNLTLLDARLLESCLTLFIPLLLFVFYRKKVSMRVLSILLVGFFGVALLLQPQLQLAHFASFAALGNGCFLACTFVLSSQLSKTQDRSEILFYYSLFGSLMSLFPFLYFYEGGYSLSLWLHLISMSLLAALLQYLIVTAYSLMSPHIVGGLSNVDILFGAFLGWAIFAEGLNVAQILGGTLLIASCLYLIRENSKVYFLTNSVLSGQSE